MADIVQFPDNEHSRDREHAERMNGLTKEFSQALGNALGIRDVQPYIDTCKHVWETEGAVLRALRISKGLTPGGVAKGLGVSSGRIKRLEAGAPVNDALLLKKAYMLFLTHPSTQVLQEVMQ